MAQSLQLLNRRIKTAKNIAQISKAMEMISASKIKRAQKAVEANKPYAARIVTLTQTILSRMDLETFKHPYINGNGSDKTLLLAISPDKGLCGSLNTNLFKKFLEAEDKNTRLVALGKKISQFGARTSGEMIANFNLGTVLPEYIIVYQLIEIVKKEYMSGNVGKVQILFNQFNSIFSQEPVIKTILPIEVVAQEGQLPYLFEPKPEEIINDLLPYYLEAVVYNAIIEAFTSEQAARMVAMQNAKNNALDIADYLTLSYNKQRQEKITSELLSLSNSN
jgi:F-type H+-transporting ATPase subunit gamma